MDNNHAHKEIIGLKIRLGQLQKQAKRITSANERLRNQMGIARMTIEDHHKALVSAREQEHKAKRVAEDQGRNAVDLFDKLKKTERTLARCQRQSSDRMIGLAKCGIERKELRGQVELLRKQRDKEHKARAHVGTRTTKFIRELPKAHDHSVRVARCLSYIRMLSRELVASQSLVKSGVFVSNEKYNQHCDALRFVTGLKDITMLIGLPEKDMVRVARDYLTKNLKSPGTDSDRIDFIIQLIETQGTRFPEFPRLLQEGMERRGRRFNRPAIDWAIRRGNELEAVD